MTDEELNRIEKIVEDLGGWNVGNWDTSDLIFYARPLVNAAPALLAHIRELRAGINHLRRGHPASCFAAMGGECNCLAKDYNAEIDRLLGAMP